MTSGVRNILSEAVLWLSIFIIALAGFFYLDERIGAFMEKGGDSTLQQTARSVDGDPGEDHDSASGKGADRGLSSGGIVESGNGRVVLQAGRSGHFEVTAYINDSSIDLMADTGASYVVLTYEDAQTLGIAYDLKFTGRARTANGVSKVAPVMLDAIEVGDITVRNVQAVVAEEGKMSKSLLGMSFISRLDRFEMSGRQLVLVE